MKRQTVQAIESPAVWGQLISPVRAEILEALRLLGPCTIAKIATTLDRPADSLYRHLEILRKTGAVVDAGFRKGSRNVEQLFDVVAEDFAIAFHDSTGAAENRAVVSTANSFLKAMARAVRDSAAARQLEFQPGRQNISISYELSRLTPPAFEKIRGLIRQLKAVMDEGKKQTEGQLYMTLVVATPVTRRRGAGARSSQVQKHSSTKTKAK